MPAGAMSGSSPPSFVARTRDARTHAHPTAAFPRPRDAARAVTILVLYDHGLLGRTSLHLGVERIDVLEMRHDVAAALGRAAMDDELARDVSERAQPRHLPGLTRRRRAQVGARFRPR